MTPGIAHRVGDGTLSYIACVGAVDYEGGGVMARKTRGNSIAFVMMFDDMNLSIKTSHGLPDAAVCVAYT